MSSLGLRSQGLGFKGVDLKVSHPKALRTPIVRLWGPTQTILSKAVRLFRALA